MASITRTASTTAGWVALDSDSGSVVSILNKTGADLQIRKAAETGAGEQITIPDGSSVALSIAANASEIEIKGAGVATGVQYIVDRPQQ
jgi:hypothetical protein